MNQAQLLWYSLMMAEDKEKDFDKNLSYLEYHASFTNYEGVKKAKEFRQEQKEDSIKEAEQFINSVKTNEFKNNPLIDAIKKLRESSAQNSNKESVFNSINLNKLIKDDI
jgi:hypothetical protein